MKESQITLRANFCCYKHQMYVTSSFWLLWQFDGMKVSYYLFDAQQVLTNIHVYVVLHCNICNLF